MIDVSHWCRRCGPITIIFSAAAVAVALFLSRCWLFSFDIVWGDDCDAVYFFDFLSTFLFFSFDIFALLLFSSSFSCFERLLRQNIFIDVAFTMKYFFDISIISTFFIYYFISRGRLFYFRWFRLSPLISMSFVAEDAFDFSFLIIFADDYLFLMCWCSRVASMLLLLMGGRHYFGFIFPSTFSPSLPRGGGFDAVWFLFHFDVVVLSWLPTFQDNISPYFAWLFFDWFLSFSPPFRLSFSSIISRCFRFSRLFSYFDIFFPFDFLAFLRLLM